MIFYAPNRPSDRPPPSQTHRQSIPTRQAQTDVEGQSENSTPSVDRALFAVVKVLHTDDSEDGVVFVVSSKEHDSNEPQHWPLARQWLSMVTCCVIGIAMTLLTSVEGPAQNTFDAHYGVGPLAGSMTTGIFLIGIGVGSLFAGPFPETFGRKVVNFSALVLALLFIIAKALAPNYGTAIAFRCLCALFAAAPMTVGGGYHRRRRIAASDPIRAPIFPRSAPTQALYRTRGRRLYIRDRLCMG